MEKKLPWQNRSEAETEKNCSISVPVRKFTGLTLIKFLMKKILERGVSCRRQPGGARIDSVLFERPFRTVLHDSDLSMKDCETGGCPLRERLKNMTQRIWLTWNPEPYHDANDFQDLAERVPHHDFASDAEIWRASRAGTVSQRGWSQSLPNLASPFFIQLLNCSNVRLFSCFPIPFSFHVPCSSVLPSRVKIKIFTLIELLIVISIIAILASMLLPALSKTRDAARKTQCLNQLKTLGTAVALYTDDFGGYYPYALDNTRTPTANWTVLTVPYISSIPDWITARNSLSLVPARPERYRLWASYICPVQKYRSWGEYNSGLGSFQGNYVANAAVLHSKNPPSTDENGRKSGTSRNPSRNGLIWDGIGSDPSASIATVLLHVTRGSITGEPHSRTTNGVFLDGHVENMRMNPKLPFAAQGTWASAVLFY